MLHQCCFGAGIPALPSQWPPLYRQRTGPLCGFLEFGAHLLVKLGGVAAFELEDFPICCDAEDALLDDGAGVHPGHINVAAVVFSVDVARSAGSTLFR